MDPTRDLLQILHRRHQPRRNARQLRAQVIPLRRQVRLRRAQRQTQRNKPLLRPVMQIALDLPASLIRSRNDPPPRRRQLGLALRVRNRRRDELGEFVQSLLCVGGEFLDARDRHGTPKTTLHHDGGRDSRNDTQASQHVGQCGRPLSKPLIDANGTSGLKDARRRHGIVERPARSDLDSLHSLPKRDGDEGRRFALEPADGCQIRTEQTADLLDDDREDLFGLQALGHQRRDAP
jgi:hypothetical protein